MRRSILPILFLIPSLFLIIGLFYYPLFQTLWLSFYHVEPGSGKAYFIGLENYFRAISDTTFYRVLLNSFTWTVLVVAFQFLVGFYTALLLSQNLKFRSIARAIVILPWSMPGVIAGILWIYLYDALIGPINWSLMQLGFIKGPIAWLGSPNTALLSVIFTAIWKGFPFSTLMYLAAIQAIPNSLLEAAEIDGAGILGKIRHVIIPYISPVIKLTVMLTSIWTFNYFDLVWVMTHGGPINSSHIFPTYVYQIAFEWFDFGMGSVYGIIDAAILLVFSLIYIKVLGKGWVD